MVGWNPWNLNLAFLRHAHSHLMFFGWATPAPMIYIGRHLQKQARQPQGLIRLAIGLMLLLGLASYPFFLFYGYRPVPIGSLHLPLAAILSGLVMLTWYLFIYAYIRQRQNLPARLSTSCFDTALILLFLGSLGAWGVSVVQALDLQNPFWGKGLTHLFLIAFTEGWVVLSILGIYYSIYDVKVSGLREKVLLLPLLLGVPLLFPFGMSTSLLSVTLLTAARLGGLVVGLTLLYHGWIIWETKNNMNPPSFIWMFPFVLFLIKTGMQLGASALPSDLWVGQHGLRVLYIHIVLLGFATPAFLISYRDSTAYHGWQRCGIEFSIGFLFVTLLPLTPAWPAALSGHWIFYMLCVGAAFPSLAMLPLLFSNSAVNSSDTSS